MKSIIVKVQIQFDVFDDKNPKEAAIKQLESINEVIQQRFNDASPQIFVNAIDNSDIEVANCDEDEDEFEESNPKCKKYTDAEALPDENDNCSLCGGDCVEQ